MDFFCKMKTGGKEFLCFLKYWGNIFLSLKGWGGGFLIVLRPNNPRNGAQVPQKFCHPTLPMYDKNNACRLAFKYNPILMKHPPPEMFLCKDRNNFCTVSCVSFKTCVCSFHCQPINFMPPSFFFPFFHTCF